MIVDASELVCIAFREDGFERYSRAIVDAAGPLIAGPTWLETVMVIEGKHNDVLTRRFAAIWNSIGLMVVPFEARAAEYAVDAFRRYGKGMHPAKLNFGACISYGFAKSMGLPLLYKGHDFALTDITPALA